MRVNPISANYTKSFPQRKLNDSQPLKPPTNSYDDVQTPSFSGLFGLKSKIKINDKLNETQEKFDKLIEQHKIENKVYKIQAESSKAINQANFLRDDALFYLKKGDTLNSRLTRKHLMLCRFITRSDDNGNIFLDCTYDIDEKEKVRNLVKFDKNMNVESIAVNANYDDDLEVYKADKIFYFTDNKLVSYVDNYFVNTFDNTVAMGGQYSYSDGDLVSYSKGTITDIGTGDVTSQETYELKDTIISQYTKDMQFSPEEQTVTYGKLINFDKKGKISNIFGPMLKHINID